MVDDFGRAVVTKRRSLHSNVVFLILGCREGGDSKMLPSNKSLPKSGFLAKYRARVKVKVKAEKLFMFS